MTFPILSGSHTTDRFQASVLGVRPMWRPKEPRKRKHVAAVEHES